MNPLEVFIHKSYVIANDLIASNAQVAGFQSMFLRLSFYRMCLPLDAHICSIFSKKQQPERLHSECGKTR